MKKIVGIIAAVAMAASVFAADLTGGVRLGGDLFNYNGTSEAAKALMLQNENRNWEAPLTLSISSDNAGGTFKFWDGQGTAFETGKWNIWFKPMDMLKVNLGSIDKSMNVETIDWGGRLINYDSFGASLDVNVDAFSMTLSFVPGKGSFWFKSAKTLKAEDAAIVADAKAKAEDKENALARILADKYDAEVAELNLYAQYAADFGTISAMFDFSKTFKDIKMGAGYKNKFGDITMFADAAFYMAKATKDADFVNSIGVDADVTYAKDALNAQAYVKWTAPLKDMKKETMGLLALAKVSYALDKGTVYLYFKDGNLMADDFGCTIKPGFTSNVGIMSYEIAAQFDIAKKVNISVPVNFKVNF